MSEPVLGGAAGRSSKETSDCRYRGDQSLFPRGVILKIYSVMLILSLFRLPPFQTKNKTQ